jgi:hypothetical protein
LFAKPEPQQVGDSVAGLCCARYPVDFIGCRSPATHELDTDAPSLVGNLLARPLRQPFRFLDARAKSGRVALLDNRQRRNVVQIRF